jgi:hypothetical protein
MVSSRPVALRPAGCFDDWRALQLRSRRRQSTFRGVDDTELYAFPQAPAYSWILPQGMPQNTSRLDCWQPDPVAAYLLSELAEYLHLSGVTGRSIPQPPPEVVELDPAQDELLASLAEATDLDGVAALCERLYGDPESPHYVYGDQERGHTYTTEDSARVRDAYRTAGEPIPRRLTHNRGNVITVRRALSIAYGPNWSALLPAAAEG